MPMNDIHFGCRTEEDEGPVSIELRDATSRSYLALGMDPAHRGG